MRLVRRVSSRSNDALWASLLSQYVTFHTSHYSPPHFSASRAPSLPDGVTKIIEPARKIYELRRLKIIFLCSHTRKNARTCSSSFPHFPATFFNICCLMFSSVPGLWRSSQMHKWSDSFFCCAISFVPLGKVTERAAPSCF